MIARLGVLSVLVLALLGCAGLERDDAPRASEIAPPRSVAQALASAKDYAGRDDWPHALETLDAAVRRFPDDKRVKQARAALVERRDYRERVLNDEILIEDAESQQRRLALLERLGRMNPDDLLQKSRRMYWRETLAAKVERLTRCGEVHVARTPVLARRCYAVASALTVSDPVERRLQAVAAQLRESEQLAAQRRQARVRQGRERRAKGLLNDARAAIDAHDYRQALDSLAKLAKLQPNNAEVAGLQRAAWAMISPQVEALVKLGDHLYLDEQLEAAVATWQAALDLKPHDADILARIERARTVLDRLDMLRKRQQSGSAG